MYVIKDNTFNISVRNLVEFMCLGGDIDNRDTGVADVKVMQEGARLHRKIQHSPPKSSAPSLIALYGHGVYAASLFFGISPTYI